MNKSQPRAAAKTHLSNLNTVLASPFARVGIFAGMFFLLMVLGLTLAWQPNSSANAAVGGQITVYVDFDDDDPMTVIAHVDCMTASIPQNDLTVSEGNPADFFLYDSTATTNSTCQAFLNDVPTGYQVDDSNCANLDDSGSTFCTIYLNLVSAQFIIDLDFADDSADSGTITLACGSGNVSPTSTSASESQDAQFTVTDFTPGTTCTATVSDLTGYTADESGCFEVDLYSTRQCTITAALNTADFTVSKDFSDNSASEVTITLTCDTGNVSPTSTTVTENTPVTFTITGFDRDTPCTATEPIVPDGYEPDDSACATIPIDIAPAGPYNCTLVNTLKSHTFTVHKDFSDDNPIYVSIDLTCTSGVVETPFLSASEAAPALFTVTGYSSSTTCAATELSVPGGYTLSDADCLAVDLESDGECTITNTLKSATFTVHKDFSDDNAVSVSVTLGCSSGFVETSPLDASEAAAAVFTVTGFDDGVLCSAAEAVVPEGYTVSDADCLAVDLVNDGECTITNTLKTAGFTVDKDFSDGNPMEVQIALSCTSGSVQTTPLGAVDSLPAIFTVTGYSDGVTCTATEPIVPAGYTSNDTDCANVDLVGDGLCTLTNTLKTAQFTVYKDFGNNSSASVSIELSCSSGVVANSPLDIAEGNPGSFTVNGYDEGVTCTATEPSVPDGYVFSQNDCLDVALTSPGQCTIINDAKPKLTVHKYVTNDNGGTSQPERWSIHVNDFAQEANGSPFTASNAGTELVLEPGTYFVSESESSNFNLNRREALRAAVSSGYAASFSGDCDFSGTIALALNQVADCTITNDDQPATLTIIKTVDNSNGGTKNAADWTMLVSGTNVSSASFAGEDDPGTLVFLDAGSYSVSESATPDGYDAAYSADCAGTMQVGESKTCIITNTARMTFFTVHVDFSDDSSATVTAHLTCSSGNLDVTEIQAQENISAQFTLTEYANSATCTATASNVPDGYSADASGCAAVGLVTPSECTLVITLVSTSPTADGDLDNPAIWTNGAPTANTDVTIPAGRTITVNSPATIGGLVLEPGSALILNANLNLNGDLTLGTVLDTLGQTLGLGCASNVNGPSASNYVIGTVRKDFCVTGAFSYPIGTANGYSPVDVNITALGTNPSALTLTTHQTNYTGMTAAQSAYRYWTLTETNDLTANLTFYYLDGDIHGNEATYKLYKWENSMSMLVPSTLNTAANTIGASGISEFSDWTIGNQGNAPTSATLTKFATKKTGAGNVKLVWETGSEANVLGFQVWRKTKKGEWMVLNPALVAAQYTGEVRGAEYVYTDGGVKKGKTYQYRIEVVYADGSSEWSGTEQIKLKKKK